MSHPQSYPHKPAPLTTALPERVCAVCGKAIEPDAHYIEVFRAESALGTGRKLGFVEVSCAVAAFEKWLKQKEAKASAPAPVETPAPAPVPEKSKVGAKKKK